MTADSSGTPGLELLEGARNRDDDAFRRLVEPHCGSCTPTVTGWFASVHDATTRSRTPCSEPGGELPKFEGRSSLRSWLYRIATNACLDRIAQRPKRAVPVGIGPAADPHDGPGGPLVEST